MSKISLLAVFIVSIITLECSQASVGGYFSENDAKKFTDILNNGLKQQEDVTNYYHAARGLSLLKKPIDVALSKNACSFLQKSFKEGTPEATFKVLNAWILLKCGGKLHNEAQVKNIKAVLEDKASSTESVRYALEVLATIGESVPNAGKIAKNIQDKLREDDSLPSLGHALHAGVLLGNEGKFVADRIQEIVVQADEIDGKLLQWEGGLTTTSLIITGLMRNSAAGQHLNQKQVDKLANYLLSRKTVPSPKGVWALLEAAEALNSYALFPVCITIDGEPFVTAEKPDLKIRVSNLFGGAVRSKTSVTPVVAQSATRISDDVVVLSKQSLNPGTTQTEFILPLKLTPGHYRIQLTAGSNTQSVESRVLGPIAVQSLEIGLMDADGSSAPKLNKLQHPQKLTSILQGDSSQHLVVKFTLSRSVHQAFIRLSSQNKEIIFVGEEEAGKLYKVEINLGNELSQSGDFDIELILGDSLATNSIRWNLGVISVSLPSASLSAKTARGPKPEINHLFRVADKRPAEVVSLLFTALTLSPILLLLILWARIGVNMGNFSVLAVPFHLGFGGILALFTLFWLKLNMFTTCAWLIPIGGFTLFFGHKLLSSIASGKKPEKADK
ncbi:unnamed protein product [Brassicogethes aeneus]|uniref:Dolichyl-diphosphooligosaccharide--protein glycosyltransferase subunit 2 n=1 Tax=Brassicogethes aeneus TaxID=1431903 RepID=A0A9P0B7E8_BRAAE|nr:unnamed protein product [Brassicogethes aeneus]